MRLGNFCSSLSKHLRPERFRSKKWKTKWFSIRKTSSRGQGKDAALSNSSFTLQWLFFEDATSTGRRSFVNDHSKSGRCPAWSTGCPATTFSSNGPKVLQRCYAPSITAKSLQKCWIRFAIKTKHEQKKEKTVPTVTFLISSIIATPRGTQLLKVFFWLILKNHFTPCLVVYVYVWLLRPKQNPDFSDKQKYLAKLSCVFPFFWGHLWFSCIPEIQAVLLL